MIKPEGTFQEDTEQTKDVGPVEALMNKLMELPLPVFEDSVIEFNTMYRMPVSALPTLTPGFDVLERMKNFKKIISKELDEIDDIIEKIETQGVLATNAMEAGGWFIDLTDLLADLQVYAASEMVKYGMAQAPSMNIVMQSNFSKMGEDGKPIFDAEDKLQKGPNYWKPEPRLATMTQSRLRFLTTVESSKTPEEKIAVIKSALKDGTLESAVYGVVNSPVKVREFIADRIDVLYNHAKSMEALGQIDKTIG